MALVNIGFRFFYSFMDTGGNVSTLTFDAVSADYTQALLDLDLVRVELQALTKATLIRYGITDTFEEDAISLPAQAEIENKASITLLLAGSIKRANIRIPAPADALFVGASGPSYNQVNTGNTNLIQLVDYMKAGSFLRISDGEAVDGTTPIQAGKRVHVKSTRG
jgi:hypothetical protein